MRLERLETLLWERIDGVINAEDEAELEAFLAEDDEAREIELELTALAKRLAGVRPAVPPPILRKRIDEALAAAQRRTADERVPSGVVSRRMPIRWAPQLLAMAASLLLGVAIGFLLRLSGGGPVDASRAAGTIYAPLAHETSATWEIVLGEGAGTLGVRRNGTVLSVELMLAGEHEAELRLDADSGELQISGVRRQASGPDEIFAAAGRVVVRTAGGGSMGVDVGCSDPTAPVLVVVSVDGETVAKRWIGPVGEGERP